MIEKTVVENLAEVSGLLEQAVGTIRSGEAFHPDFADECLYFLGAVVELGRLSGDAGQESLGRAEAFLNNVSQRLDDGDEFALTADDLDALETLRDLAQAGRSVAEVLDRQKGRLYALVNPVSYQGNTLLCENDRGIYEDVWAALGDLAEAKRWARNPDLYLACLTGAVKLLYPECREGAVAPARQATYDRLIGLAWEALDKLNIADEIVDPYEDGTPFCADLCGALHDLLVEIEHRGGPEAEAIVLYAPDNGEVLIVNDQVIDTSDGTAPGDYLDVPRVFFADLGRALGIQFTVQVVEVDPCALAGEYWSWEEVAAAWLAQRAGKEPAG